MKKRILCFALAVCLCFAFAGCGGNKTDGGSFSNGRKEIQSNELQFTLPSADSTVAIIDTSAGTFYAMLFPDKAPLAVENFISLAESGFYNGLEFYRVESNFVIETGSPQNNGVGGTSKWGNPFADEYSPFLHHYAGALCMANTAAKSERGNSTVFYVVAADENSVDKSTLEKLENAGISADVINAYKEAGGLPYLDNTDTVFGQIYMGMEVVDAINAAETDENLKPLQPITVTGIRITTYGAQQSAMTAELASSSAAAQ